MPSNASSAAAAPPPEAPATRNSDSGIRSHQDREGREKPQKKTSSKAASSASAVPPPKAPATQKSHSGLSSDRTQPNQRPRKRTLSDEELGLAGVQMKNDVQAFMATWKKEDSSSATVPPVKPLGSGGLIQDLLATSRRSKSSRAPYQWQVEGDDGWIDYLTIDNKKIEDAYKKGEKVEVCEQWYVVDPVAMTQTLYSKRKSRHVCKVRAIRRTSGDDNAEQELKHCSPLATAGSAATGGSGREKQRTLPATSSSNGNSNSSGKMTAKCSSRQKPTSNESKNRVKRKCHFEDEEEDSDHEEDYMFEESEDESLAAVMDERNLKALSEALGASKHLVAKPWIAAMAAHLNSKLGKDKAAALVHGFGMLHNAVGKDKEEKAAKNLMQEKTSCMKSPHAGEQARMATHCQKKTCLQGANDDMPLHQPYNN